MEDLRAQDRGHAGMPQAPGSADGRQGRAEAEAERAGLNEGQAGFHDSVRGWWWWWLSRVACRMLKSDAFCEPEAIRTSERTGGEPLVVVVVMVTLAGAARLTIHRRSPDRLFSHLPPQE